MIGHISMMCYQEDNGDYHDAVIDDDGGTGMLQTALMKRRLAQISPQVQVHHPQLQLMA